MTRLLRRVLFGLLLVGGSSCIIGTWPTPEGEDREDASPRASGFGSGAPSSGNDSAIAPEGCDGVDNDADGVIDEGCRCSDQVRACIGTLGNQCGLGLQRCQKGVWQTCTEVGAPLSAVRTPTVEIRSATPALILRGGTEQIELSVEPITHCSGIQVAHVTVQLEAATPLMRVIGEARDDGDAPDLVAGDGLYGAVLSNPFGPGVPAQELTLSASALINDQETIGSTKIALEEP